MQGGMHGRIVAYLPAYATHRTPPYDIHTVPGDRLSHLVYAFAGFKQQGTEWVVDYPEPDDPTKNFPVLGAVKQRWPHLKILLSLGGWANSQKLDPSGRTVFSTIAASDQSRQAFVASCIERFFAPPLTRVPPEHVLFDGIDVDWEYPTAPDRQNFTLLLQEFRRQLDDLGRRSRAQFALTIAVDVLPRNIDVPAVAGCVDMLNLMGYVAHQPNLNARNKYTDFNSPLYSSPQEPASNVTWNIDEGITSLLGAGVRSDQLVLGINAYARTYAGVQNVNQGLYQPYTGPAPAPPHGQAGILAYDQLVARYLPTYDSRWDPVTHSAYLYSPTADEWMSFDSVDSVRDKATYANQHRLGGLMLWELTADVIGLHPGPLPSSSLSLVDTMHATLQRN
jgi:chitinase